MTQDEQTELFRLINNYHKKKCELNDIIKERAGRRGTPVTTDVMFKMKGPIDSIVDFVDGLIDDNGR